ncbi:hypothetical protein [Micromonospora aurantiaca (nom. illeg.)]|uniref:hypothetical protein n=1 Tax=Micromonospora aurantiaca (nom. illeg.) TaxID=47850 RepID=UPI0037ABA5DF
MPSIWWQRGWDQGSREVREALNGEGAFDVGYEQGRRECERILGQVRRLAEAAEAARQGDRSLMDELAREQGSEPAPGDDLLDVAEAAGVTPLREVDADQLLDDLERWLREQD